MRTSYEIQMLPPAESGKGWRYTVTISTSPGDTWTSPPSAPLVSPDREGAVAEALAAVKTLSRTLEGVSVAP